MRKNDLIQSDGMILRILSLSGDKVFAIDCLKRNMPKWYRLADLEKYEPCSEERLIECGDIDIFDVELLDTATRKTVHERFTVIAGILPFVADEKMRNMVIAHSAEENGICKQTVRNYLCLYLAYQHMSALAPKRTDEEKPLTIAWKC